MNPAPLFDQTTLDHDAPAARLATIMEAALAHGVRQFTLAYRSEVATAVFSQSFAGKRHVLIELPRSAAFDLLQYLVRHASATPPTWDNFSEALHDRMFSGQRAFSTRGALWDLRISGLPIAASPTGPGYDLHLRITRTSPRELMRLADLSMDINAAHAIEGAMMAESGLVVLSGPSGSGTTTTAAAAIREAMIHQPGLRVASIQNTIEVDLPGCTHFDADFTAGSLDPFPAMLRNAMRADPDVIFVGDLNSPGRAEVVLEAIRAGHLVVTTLPADGALHALTRLHALGVPWEDLQQPSFIRTIVSQHLLPQLCRHCRMRDRDGAYAASADGCRACHGTGYSGFVACAEALSPNESIVSAIEKSDFVTAERLWRAMRPFSGARTLREQADLKVQSGLIDPADAFEAFGEVAGSGAA